MASSDSKSIVIIGGGIVGISTAYYLTRHKLFNPAVHSITVLEASGIASGSSGKGGGFIASWATPKCLAPLSFSLHTSLAREHGGSTAWGYRNVHAAEASLVATTKESTAASNSEPKSSADSSFPRELDWLNPASCRAYSQAGTPSDSAQVHPFLLTTTLARLARDAGAKIISGRATCINHKTDEDSSSGLGTGSFAVAPGPARKAVESVTFVDDQGASQTMHATDVLVAAGPWTPALLPEVKLLTPKCHSLVIRPTRGVSPYVLFCSITGSGGKENRQQQQQQHVPLMLDIYPRPPDALHATQTVYASGPDCYDDTPLPATSAEVTVEDFRCSEVWNAVSGVSSLAAPGAGAGEGKGGEVLTRQACHKAQIRRHADAEEVGPMIGPLQQRARGLWLATGLDEWGIQNGPAVGLVVSEMLLEGEAKSADVEALDPKHWI